MAVRTAPIAGIFSRLSSVAAAWVSRDADAHAGDRDEGMLVVDQAGQLVHHRLPMRLVTALVRQDQLDQRRLALNAGGAGRGERGAGIRPALRDEGALQAGADLPDRQRAGVALRQGRQYGDLDVGQAALPGRGLLPLGADPPVLLRDPVGDPLEPGVEGERLLVREADALPQRPRTGPVQPRLVRRAAVVLLGRPEEPETAGYQGQRYYEGGDSSPPLPPRGEVVGGLRGQMHVPAPRGRVLQRAHTYLAASCMSPIRRGTERMARSWSIALIVRLSSGFAPGRRLRGSDASHSPTTSSVRGVCSANERGARSAASCSSRSVADCSGTTGTRSGAAVIV